MTRKRRRTPRIGPEDGMAWWNLYAHRHKGTLEPAIDIDLDAMRAVYLRDRRRFVAKYHAERERLGAGHNGFTATPVAMFETDDPEMQAQAEADVHATDAYWRKRWAEVAGDLRR